MKKAFTITELLVAVGLLAAVLSASTIIFHYAIEAQRAAMATAEIMRTLRSITDQLNYDFQGVADANQAPMIMEFQNSSNIHADSIVFFSNGDFQTMNGSVRGNIARIYYGQAYSPGKILCRKQIILVPNEQNSSKEYDSNSLSKLVNDYKNSSHNTDWLSRPTIDINDSNDISMYLAKNVNDFSISYCDSKDIDTNGTIKWQPVSPLTGERNYFGVGGDIGFKQYPALIKFTFTLYDSKKILKGGRKFEHIVYIGN